MKTDEMQSRSFRTWFNLRIGIATIAIAFPVVLWIGGTMAGLSLQESMSAYYHAGAAGAPMRSWYVGMLFAAALLLYLYKGFSDQENYALNCAAVFAIGIAIFPMEWACGDSCQPITLHTASAILFFSCIAFVCIRCAPETLYLLRDKDRETRYRKLYSRIGFGMICLPLMAVLSGQVWDSFDSVRFCVPAANIWLFGGYWLVKNRELSYTRAERRELAGRQAINVSEP